MREIKFRGKAKIAVEELDRLQIEHKNGWVFGSLITNGGSPFIVGDIVEHDEEYIAHEWWVEVHPETVGQFTGLLDKNGFGIYEDDIIQFFPHKEKSVVKFVGGCFVYRKKVPESFNMSDEVTREDCLINLLTDREYGNHCEVVGNVYQNPELLEVQP